MTRTDLWVRGGLGALFLWVFSIGGTFNGILQPSQRFVGLAVLLVLMGGWLFVRRRWRWHRHPLDVALLAWCAAFALSLIANPDQWRRIAIGLWFMALYIGVLLLLVDALTNGIRRAAVADAVLIGGAMVVFIGFTQTQSWFSLTLPYILSGVEPFNLPRPVSTLGNANTLAAALVMLIPFALWRMTGRNRLLGVVGLVYSIGAIGLLFLTFSRGGWIGAAAGILTWGVLTLAQRGLLSPQGIAGWWRAQTNGIRLAVGAGTTGALLVLLVGGVILVTSFSMGGRSVDLRTFLWETSVTMFGEKPLFGHGLFTYGRGLARLNSTPPTEPHSHAHSIPLNIAAELGIVGLGALALTLVLIAAAARRNFVTLRDPRERAVWTAAAAALAGFTVHHIFDLPAMLPAVMLLGLTTLSITIAPTQPIPAARRSASVRTAIAVTGVLALLLTGTWGAVLYQRYMAVLTETAGSGDYRAGADALLPIISTDPALAVYYRQRGMLLALASDAGDAEALASAIEAYTHYTQIAPEYVSGWANLAALHAAAGDDPAALRAFERASELAPQDWWIAYQWGRTAERLNEYSLASQAFLRAAGVNPDLILLPGWEESPLSFEIQPGERALSPYARIALRLADGDIAGAQTVFTSSPLASSVGVEAQITGALIALAQGDRPRAVMHIERARPRVRERHQQVWLKIGEIRLAQFDAQPAEVERQLAGAEDALSVELFDADWGMGVNIDYIQYLHSGIPRQFVPQLDYPMADPVALYWVERLRSQ